ncbi:anti-sigma factor domain-containing protein [Pelagovum pacificum]|uniref:Anti-sigma K factor RskA C-terminal domain-containing protein n=1 Tax=Pelagovum pacificum TaxID=2588711 RepID=A0A5C5GBA7_9RHOB|nr:anti-sigma factor [Pelagovum pacificum]QQA41588.1 anti-sigma factor [Pelagovum pacificum]TNY30867.1 hypothetical protein FHY64_17310 [Pelagovum pacificum]
MSGPDERDDDDSGLAAEYVLGLLSEGERDECVARLRSDSVFRQDVLSWTERMALIADVEVEPVTPPATLYRDLERRLFGAGAKKGFFARLGILPALLGAAAAALILLVVTQMGLLQPGGPTLTPAYQVEMASEGGDLVVVAAIDPESGMLAVNRLEGDRREGRDLQLWFAETDDAAPVSIGVLPEARVAEFALPDGATVEQAHFAVSDEPPGGSPTGSPTGDVLAVGYVEPL